MNGIYWGLTALALLGRTDALSRDDMLEWVLSCWVPDAGAFAPHPGHEPHLHPTLSAIQILATHDALDRVDSDRIVACASRPLSSSRPASPAPSPDRELSRPQSSSRSKTRSAARSPATSGASKTRASRTAPSRACRSSAASTPSTRPRRSRSSSAAGTLTAALAWSRAQRAMRRTVRPFSLSFSSSSSLSLFRRDRPSPHLSPRRTQCGPASAPLPCSTASTSSTQTRFAGGCASANFPAAGSTAGPRSLRTCVSFLLFFPLLLGLLRRRVSRLWSASAH